MPKKPTWKDFNHTERIDLLKRLNDDEIVDAYLPDKTDESEFRRLLRDERVIWQPSALGAAKTAVALPNKETIMGAWRDLNKAEALLELIDNSIDAWTRRRKRYPRYTSKTLQIYIDIDGANSRLSYEDNAGGVKEEQLPNIVIPGFSETSDTEATIGSYRTGGKKAIFKLASDASIQSYYLDPDETSEEAFDIHLDNNWLEDSEQYNFTYYPITTLGELNKGHTIYTFKLRDQAWDLNVFDQITNEIRRTYTLLIVRNPNIEIYFNDRDKPLQPLEELYKFSGANSRKIDVRPQRVRFKCQLPWKGLPQSIEIEIILGCRTTTSGGPKGEDRWGIDLYGNNRLFVHHNQDETFKWFELPTGANRTLVRGLINIHGPNIFMPWDTHKRHLNVDREIIDVLRSKPIKDLFRSWKEAYNAISGMEEIKETIKEVFAPWKVGKDLNVGFSDDVSLQLKRKRGVSLPASVHKPKVTPSKSAANKKPVTIPIKVTQAEYRKLCTTHEIDTALTDTQKIKQLSEALKSSILRRK
jgi:hypothetical protein